MLLVHGDYKVIGRDDGRRRIWTVRPHLGA
jgi:hypothetical protein